MFIAREAIIATDENYAATYKPDLWGIPKSIEQNPIAVTEWKRKNIYMENGVLVNPMGHKVADSQTIQITDKDLRSSHNFGVYQVFENGQIYFVQGKRFVDKIPELEPEGNARPTDLLEGTGYEWVEYMGGPVFFGKKLAKNAIDKVADEIGDIGKGVPKGTGKYQVGGYKDIKGVEGLDAHHAGQKAVMKKLVDNYDLNTAPAINVPKIGHTIKGPNGIISRSAKGIKNPRNLLARDIMELRRVYDDIPNSSLKELIELNKKMYPEMRKYSE